MPNNNTNNTNNTNNMDIMNVMCKMYGDIRGKINSIFDNINTILKNTGISFSLNYKSWILAFLCVYVISGNAFTGAFSYIVTILVTYFAHAACHAEENYPYNCVHLYHHTHSNYMSHIIQIILEFFSILSLLIATYVLDITGYMRINTYICNWVIVFVYIFYTTVHNINYSIHHVNNVHEMHHKLNFSNYGPDICDILFDSKYQPNTDIENTDHYLLNIIASTIIVLGIKYVWSKNNENKEIMTNIFKILYSTSFGLLFLATVVIYINDTTEKNRQYNLLFGEYMNKISKYFN